MSQITRYLILAFAAAALSLAVNAQSAPNPKPAQLHASNILSTQDATTLRRAISAARRFDWNRVDQLRSVARDEQVQDILLWLLANSESQRLGFDDLNAAVVKLADWPRATTIRIRAEGRIGGSALSHPQRIAWLKQNDGPISGAGKAALALSLMREGLREDALIAARDAWHNNTLDTPEYNDLLRLFGSEFTGQDHAQRADFLLWTGQRSAARRLSSRLSPDYRALVQARIALQARQRGVDRRVQAVPKHLQNHPGLLYDRAKWRRRSGFRNAVSPLLVQIDGEQVPEVARDNLWAERRLAVRAAIKEEDDRLAYRLSKPHGMNRGVDFAEAEWISGWLSLRHLDDPETAFQHFSVLRAGVSTPISVSRAEYWLARSLDAQGLANEANAAYQEGAQHKFSFYGQLAAEKISQKQIALPEVSAPTEADRARFEARPLVRVLRLIGETGDANYFRQFAFHLDDQLDQPGDHDLLAELAREYQYPDVGVRGGKASVQNGVLAIDAAYPLLALPESSRRRVENAFVLAISRQESELNPKAISYANAHGLMQLLPSTARQQARREGLPYRKSWLTDDPDYNIRLGSAHLGDLVRSFDGSYIMAAAAYNAGARRPRQWVRDYGDPRLGEIDPVDWIEHIPFSQTRDYVQRILENIQVYRARLGESETISLNEDIRRGGYR